MIPRHIRISGFLSYREPVEIDFTTFDLACISGQNGAGKSSLLDAMTWALFGQARKRDDSLVNLQSKAAEVAFTFGYEGNIYRVLRTLPRGKTTVLEFQIKDDNDWRPLTERSMRETQARIEQTLRLDYETFINAAFFLQGKADQFTQLNAGKRKDILGNILGLEVWETYKERTAEKRRALEDEVGSIDGRIADIDTELSEEEPRKQRLNDLEAELKRLTSARKTQESALENIKKTAASLEQQNKLVETLAAALERSRTHHSGLQNRLAKREAARAADADLASRAKEVESAYKAWQKTRKELEEWDEVAFEFREHEKDRAPLLEQIAAEKARLEEEQRGLKEQEKAISEQLSATNELAERINAEKKFLAEAEAKLTERGELETQSQAAREKQAGLKAENEALKAEMDKLKERIDTLESAEGAACPLCGQPLSAAHRKSTLKELRAEGKEKGDRFRANLDAGKQLAEQITDYDLRIASLESAEKNRIKYSNSVVQLTERLETLQSLAKEWESTGRKRLKELEKILEGGKYAVEAQKQLAKLDKELAKLGYDAALHDAARKAESEQRSAEEEFNQLEKARAALKPIEDEIANLKSEIVNRESEMGKQEAEYLFAKENLDAAQLQAPNVNEVERALFDLQEQENRVRDEGGAARQKVSVLDQQRARKADLGSAREALALQIARHKTLERAFGKDGVPALLIEQALPQIESKANELLDRLSDGQMSIRFVTQAEYKDRKREDLKETLDIKISDSAGVRDYEMYSGGEAFRVNFAIRLALSEVLAQRKGARLQTLVIDEGFGSQDAQGRQRLIEAINLVKSDFAKILVITHLDELKDAFPTRIEVEKTDRGSAVRVI
ncbi:MAG: SMC family ATPase [Chloroflexi bacterium]|nr:SMC family ATPase [Chloroflexota bacterium]MBI3341460.1 SMC family ATPase [Chloroflexota bacterium]